VPVCSKSTSRGPHDPPPQYTGSGAQRWEQQVAIQLEIAEVGQRFFTEEEPRVHRLPPISEGLAAISTRSLPVLNA
jgi:hypothetical protein